LLGHSQAILPASPLRVLVESVNGYTQTGNYVDTVIFAPTGCKQIKLLKLIVLAPLEGYAEVQPEQNGQMNGSAQFVVTQGWGPFSYQWENGETGASVSGLSAGTYRLTITDANQCTHAMEVEVPAGRHLHRLEMRQQSPVGHTTATVYPNPVGAGAMEAVFSLQNNESVATEGELWVLDALGRQVSLRKVRVHAGENNYLIAEQLSPGLYTVCLKGGDGWSALAKLLVR
jgi:hypothetical protein